jgi:hypothetical protein
MSSDGSTIKDFARNHRLKITKDGEADNLEFVIRGRVGESLVYEYSDTELAVAFVTDGKKPPRTGLYRAFVASCLSAGMIPRQSGDAEGSFSFDPENEDQAKAAIRGIRARIKRQVSPELAAAGAARLAASRQARNLPQNPQQEALSGG